MGEVYKARDTRLNRTPSRTYDVAPDGRFLMVAEPELEHATRQINVVLNWPGELVEPHH